MLVLGRPEVQRRGWAHAQRNGPAMGGAERGYSSLCFKCTLPWHLTALMRFLVIGAEAVEGLLNWSSETLRSAMLCSGSQR